MLNFVHIVKFYLNFVQDRINYLFLFFFQSLSEAQCLANQVEMYFCNPNQAKKQLLETFTFRPNEFHHQDLISQIENISLLTEELTSSSALGASSSEKVHPEK